MLQETKVAQLSGKSIIGSRRGDSAAGPFHGVNPSSGEALAPTYHSASDTEVNQAAQLAGKAFEIYRESSGSRKAAFLRRIADNIEQLGDTLTRRATEETALPAARIHAETARTCFQL